jgi:hypothetical protein
MKADDDGWSLNEAEASAGRFKWGWNADTREAVAWAVSGPGDGRPVHDGFLSRVWGRRPSVVNGDVLGTAVCSGGPEQIVVHAYFGKAVPVAVVEWFEKKFPSASVSVLPGAG